MKPFKRRANKIADLETGSKQPLEGAVPRITNETVATHREDVLKKARKYIYPLQYSKNRIVIITTSIVIVAIVGFFSYCTLALYKFQSYSDFLYRVTQVIPFPIARVNGHFVSYNNYLFELEHYVHYYETQQNLNFNTPSGQAQLSDYKSRALQDVINNAYISELAAKNHVSVSGQQLNNQITIYREQNKLGNNQTELENVLKTYYGWTLNDFKRELKNQLLEQDVLSKLDTATHQRAQSVLDQLNGGANFATLASQSSDDTATKSSGGQYQSLISENDINVSPYVISALFATKVGQYTGIINTGFSLEIDKNLAIQNNQIQAAPYRI